MEIIESEKRCIGCMQTGIDMLGVNPNAICGDCWGLLCQYNSEKDDDYFSEEENMTDQLRIYSQRAKNEKREQRRIASALSVAHIPDPLADSDILS